MQGTAHLVSVRAMCALVMQAPAGPSGAHVSSPPPLAERTAQPQALLPQRSAPQTPPGPQPAANLLQGFTLAQGAAPLQPGGRTHQPTPSQQHAPPAPNVHLPVAQPAKGAAASTRAVAPGLQAAAAGAHPSVTTGRPQSGGTVSQGGALSAQQQAQVLQSFQAVQYAHEPAQMWQQQQQQQQRPQQQHSGQAGAAAPTATSWHSGSGRDAIGAALPHGMSYSRSRRLPAIAQSIA